MSTTTQNDLASRLNLGEATSWRLHWLLCDAWQLQRDIAGAHIGGRVADLYEGVFAELLDRVKRLEGAYQRLRWETKTMLGFDYEDDVDPLFAALPKNEEFASELAKTKSLLQAVVDRVLAAESKHLQSSIASAGHPLS